MPKEIEPALMFRMFQIATKLAHVDSDPTSEDTSAYLTDFKDILAADEFAFVSLEPDPQGNIAGVGRIKLPQHFIVHIPDEDEQSRMKHILPERRVCRYHYESPQGNDSIYAKIDGDLFSNNAHSTLWVALTDINNQRFGFLVAARLHPDNENPKSARFSSKDENVAQWFSVIFSSAFQLRTYDLHQWEAELTRHDPRTITAKLIERIQRDFGLDGIIVYLLIPRTNNLMSVHGIDPVRNRDFRKTPYIYSDADTSAATWAYKNHAFSTSNPRGDERVNKEGLDDFGIKGCLFALPLGKPQYRFGSVIAYFTDRRCDEGERSQIEQGLARVVGHATNPLSVSLSSHKAEVENYVAEILQQMMGESDLTTNLQSVLHAIIKVGFRRVRLYRYRYGDRLVGMLSEGMGNKSHLFDVTADPIVVEVLENRYTKLMHEGVSRARKQDSEFQPIDLLARLCPLKDSNGELLTDSTASKIDRPELVPWAEVPIISAGKLYGLIAADKLTETKDWEQIIELDLDALDVLAQIAGQAFAMDESRGTLIARNLRVLDDFTGLEEDIRLVQRRLLLYLTHGEEGLGFSHASLFVPTPSGSFEFSNAVGQLTREEYMAKMNHVRQKSLSDILSEASLHHDEPLNERLNGFSIENVYLDSLPENRSVANRYRPGEENGPQWAAEFWSRVQAISDEPRTDILVIRLESDNEILGMLVLDRKWDDLGIIKSDHELLESFARYATAVLSRHVSMNRRYEDIDNVIVGLCHETRQYLPELQNSMSRGFSFLEKNDVSKVRQSLLSGKRALAKLDVYIHGIEKCFNTRLTMEPVNCKSLFSLIDIATHRDHLVHALNCGRVELQIIDCDTPDFHVNAPSVAFVMRNLLRNSCQSFQLSSRSVNRVQIAAKLDMTPVGEPILNIDFWDNGPGVTLEVLRKLQDPLSTYSSKRDENKGGLGLLLSRYVMRRHGGELVIPSKPSEGFLATLLLPLGLAIES